jgi:hypothetical protein
VQKDSDLLPLIGWREWLSIPALNIPHIKAKIDTGARTSAIHAFSLERYHTADNTERVRFSVHPNQNEDDTVIECDATVIGDRSVRDSGGHEEIRPFIRVPVTLGEFTWEIDFSLTSRDNMKFRMLLGRTAMEGKFLVHPGLSYCQSEAPSR